MEQQPPRFDHMSPEQFRAAGYAMIDRIAAYWESLQSRSDDIPIASRVKPGDIFASLPPAAPEHQEP